METDRIKFKRLKGRYGDLSGQDYRSDFGGLYWAIESSRHHGGGRALWTAHAYDRDPNKAIDNGDGVLPILITEVGYGRNELEERMRGAVADLGH